MNKIYNKIILRYSDAAGVVPTVPSTNNHVDSSWLDTDIYIGELFLNVADQTMFTRNVDGIFEFNEFEKKVTGEGSYTAAYDLSPEFILDDNYVYSFQLNITTSVDGIGAMNHISSIPYTIANYAGTPAIWTISDGTNALATSVGFTPVNLHPYNMSVNYNAVSIIAEITGTDTLKFSVDPTSCSAGDFKSAGIITLIKTPK